MYKMLIVDDEVWIRERLCYTIDWVQLGIEVVGEAMDGEEAFELCKKLEPDIIITDIRMPGIDGLQFIRQLREARNESKVIIISGYSDFDYAQKAIKLGAYDYILKPIEDEVLISVAKQCVEELDVEKHKKALFAQANKQIVSSLPILKEKFFINLVNSHFSCESSMKEELEYLGLNFQGCKYMCFIVQIDQYSEIKADESWDKHLVQLVVCNIVKDFADKLAKNELFFLHSGEVVCTIISNSSSEKLSHQVFSISNGIRKMVKKILGYSVTIGIGRTFDTLFDVATSYKEAKHALQYKDYFGKDKIYDIKSLDIDYKPCLSGFYSIEALINSIKLRDKDQTLNSLESIINEIKKTKKDISPLEVKFIFTDICSSVLKTIIEGNISIEDFSKFNFEFIDYLNKLQDIDGMHLWMKTTIINVLEHLQNNSSNKKRKVVKKAMEYIEDHYKEPITLNDISEKLYLNASYFCKIFKEETGESFTKYLMKLRVNKAIELMNEPTIKIYEIAGKVGYEDVQYFTKVFKSIQGVTPMHYREKIK